MSTHHRVALTWDHTVILYPPLITFFLVLLSFFIGYPPEMGALTPLYAGVSQETEGAGGKVKSFPRSASTADGDLSKYFVPWAREATRILDKRAMNEKTQNKLEAWIDERVKEAGLA